MSISIGKIPRYQVSDIALTIYTNTSNLLKLNTEHLRNDIQFRNFKLGQINSPLQFQLYHSNVLLSQYTSNEIIHYSSSHYESNVIVHKDITIEEQLQSGSLITSNIWIQSRTLSENPWRIYDTNGTLFLDLDSYGNMNYIGNIGIGTSQPTATLEVVGNAYIHSNVFGGHLISSNVIVNEIRGLSNLQNSIQFRSSSILIDANEVIIDNPTLIGTVTYDGTIALQRSIIDILNSSNIRVVNKSLNQHALSIQQLNSTFGDTSCNNPIHIDSYISSINETRPIFTLDTAGRISSGRFTSNIPNKDAGLSYQYDDARSVYLSGFMNFTTCNEYEQTIIDKKGHIGIGTSAVLNHFLQINQPNVANTKIPSLIGFYQSSNEPKSFLQLYTCNDHICFNLDSNGTLLFQQHKMFDDRYRLEIASNAYINYLHTDNLISSTGVIDFTNSYLCNMNQILAHNIHVNTGGVLSNIFITGLTVDDINIGAFDYINIPSTGYNEFRISTKRLLYIGSNFVMNPNQYFFEVEQSNLPNDKIRIYANGDTTQDVNVIHTIANNSISTFFVTNCNTALNSVAQFEFEANKNKYQFGILNTNDFYGEAYITCNVDLTDPNRELTITNDGIRIGSKTHILKTGKVTLNNTTATNYTLGLKGDLEIITINGTSNFVITNEGNIGIGTNQPRTQMDIHTNTLLFGNMGIGTLSPSYQVDIAGTLRASRILGVNYADLLGGSFNQWVLTEEGIYFTKLACNIGIGTTSPNASLHLHTSNVTKNLFGVYHSNMALLKYDPNLLTQSHTIVNGGMVVGYVSTSNQILAPKDSLIVDGQIGIGTNYPTKSLHVQGDVHIIHTSNEGDFYVGKNYDLYISTKLTSSNILVTSGNYETVLTSLNEGFSNIAYFPPTGLIRNTALTSNGSIIEWTSASYVDGQGLLNGLSNIVIGSNGYYHSLILNMTGTIADDIDTYYTQITIPIGLSNLVKEMVEIHKLDLRSDGRFGGGSIFLGNSNNTINNTVIENRIYSYGTDQSELLLFKGTTATDQIQSIRLRAGQIALDVYSSPTTDRNPETIEYFDPDLFEYRNIENIQAYFTSNSFVANTVTTCNVQIHSITDTNGIYLLQRNIYDTPGAFIITPPNNLQYTYARIQMWGAGGGGAGADYQGVTTNGIGSILPGGGGGGGGAYGEILMPYQIFQNSTLIGNIGYGGSGGIGGYISTSTLIDTNKISSTAGIGQSANNGQNGTATMLSLSMTTGNGTLNANWYANGGIGGKVGIGTFAGIAGTGGTTFGIFDSYQSGTSGGTGGADSTGTNGINLTASGFAASGGGGGGGLPAINPTPIINRSGGNSGTSCIPYAYLSGTPVKAFGELVNETGTINVQSQNGYTITDTYGGGTGGGGSSSYSANLASGYYTAIARAKDGGWPGGGGGGGGSAKQNFPNTISYGLGPNYTGGYGGNGGNGAIIITYY